MFVRRTLTRRNGGRDYHSHRLVRSERDGAKVRQRTLLNLGGDFDLPKAQWPALCRRIEEILNGQAPLLDDAPRAVEDEAQRIAAQLLARGRAGDAEAARDPVTVDVDSLALTRPRSVGVEQVGLWAIERLGLVELLAGLGVNAALRAAAAGSIVARLAYPASERATHVWLRERSALGELLQVDFETTGAMQSYRASDALMRHREAIEAHLFDRAMDLFDLAPTVTPYDLTNTFHEGEAADQPDARRGHSKEKRSDCPLLTLGLVLDAGDFVRRSRATSARTGGQDCRVAIGHVAEPRQDVVAQVGAPAIHGPAAGIPVPGVHRDHFLAGFGQGGRAAGVGDRVPRRWPGRSRAYFFAASKFSSGNVDARFEDVFQRDQR